MLPKPYLVQWAASECGKAIRERWLPGQMYGQEQIDAAIKESKVMHRTKSKEAQDIGTRIHALIEDHINGKEPPADLGPVEFRALGEFCKWEKDNNVEWLATEIMVANEDDEFAGRLDALAMMSGKKTIVDFKVAKTISDSYFLQTAGYWSCLNWMGWQAEDRIIVRIPKTEMQEVWNKKTRRHDVLPNNLEIVRVPTELAFDLATFLHLRQVMKWTNQQILKR
jgi:hypothetical protein